MLSKIRSILPKRFRNDKPIIPVVRLQGAIGMQSPMRSGLSLASAALPLEKAFSIKKAPAVALIINSPGGSPVQSRLIFKRIRDLAEENEKEVLVFVEDVAASGGYMIAVAGDEVFVDPSSIVGSIGVVAAGFGFTELIKKIGVDRRVYTAGEKKVTLDPFQPEVPDDIAYLKGLQLELHETFIDLVKSRRADVLSEDPDLFTGKFWTGRTGCRTRSGRCNRRFARCAEGKVRRESRTQADLRTARPVRQTCSCWYRVEGPSSDRGARRGPDLSRRGAGALDALRPLKRRNGHVISGKARGTI